VPHSPSPRPLAERCDLDSGGCAACCWRGPHPHRPRRVAAHSKARHVARGTAHIFFELSRNRLASRRPPRGASWWRRRHPFGGAAMCAGFPAEGSARVLCKASSVARRRPLACILLPAARFIAGRGSRRKFVLYPDRPKASRENRRSPTWRWPARARHSNPARQGGLVEARPLGGTSGLASQRCQPALRRRRPPDRGTGGLEFPVATVDPRPRCRHVPLHAARLFRAPMYPVGS